MSNGQIVFRIRFVEQGQGGVSRTTNVPNDFPSQEVAEYMVQQAINEHFDGRVPSGTFFEIYSVTPDGVEQSYGQWLGKRAARVGVVAAVGAALGFLLGQ
jgi:hypothetical protein